MTRRNWPVSFRPLISLRASDHPQSLFRRPAMFALQAGQCALLPKKGASLVQTRVPERSYQALAGFGIPPDPFFRIGVKPVFLA